MSSTKAKLSNHDENLMKKPYGKAVLMQSCLDPLRIVGTTVSIIMPDLLPLPLRRCLASHVWPRYDTMLRGSGSRTRTNILLNVATGIYTRMMSSRVPSYKSATSGTRVLDYLMGHPPLVGHPN